MNKRFALLICVILVAVMMAACGKTNVSETTADTVGKDSAQQATVSAEQGSVDTADSTEAAETTEAIETTEPESIKVTDPVSGEDSGANVNMGVADGDYVPALEEDEPSAPTEAPKPTVSTQPTESTEPEATQPAESTTPTLPNGWDIRDITYEMYMAMSGEEQQAVIAQFGSIEDFMVWFNAIKAIYEAEHPDIEVGGDTVVDGSQIGKK